MGMFTEHEMDYAEWVIKGIDCGYIQEIDKGFRLQHGIELLSDEEAEKAAQTIKALLAYPTLVAKEFGTKKDG